MSNIILSLSSKLLKYFEDFGRFQVFAAKIFKVMCTRPFRLSLVIQHAYSFGVESVFIILLTAFFTGSVFGLQIGYVFSIFRAESLTGGASALALATELAPLVTGFLLTGRVGAAITAEIATMVVSEQVEAIEAMGVDPIDYLVVPRVWASIFVMPLLCALFMFMGTLGVYMTSLGIYAIDPGVFVAKIISLVEVSDIISGLRKMFFFSFIISFLCCYEGLSASGGAKGVGMATTQAVVKVLMLILISDLVISFIEVWWLR